jgi:hypothetical protein
MPNNELTPVTRDLHAVLAARDAMSPVLRRGEKTAAHRPDRLVRFQSDLAVYDELRLDEGIDLEIIEGDSLLHLEAFKAAAPARQTDLAHGLRKIINRKLTKRLNASLTLSHELQAENGTELYSWSRRTRVERAFL